MRVNCAPRPGAVIEDSRGKGNTPVVALLSFAMLLVSLDQYIVVVALPEIGRDLGYSAHTLQSVVSAYAVASSGFLLFGGRAADLLGRRRILVMGLALYAFASLAGALLRGPKSSSPRARFRVWAVPLSSRAPWRLSTPPSQKVVIETAHWGSGAAQARLASWSASCSVACSRAPSVGKRC